jgi:hypothetical protein
MSYDPGMLGPLDPRTLSIGMVDPTSGSWVALPTTVDTNAHLLTALVKRLSPVQIRAPITIAALGRQEEAHTVTRILSAQALTLPASAPLGTVTDGHLLAGSLPVLITLPQGMVQAGAPDAVRALGAPRAQMVVSYQWGTTAVVSRTTLNQQGYAAVAAPHLHITLATAHVAVVVSVAGMSARRSGVFHLTSAPH